MESLTKPKKTAKSHASSQQVALAPANPPSIFSTQGDLFPLPDCESRRSATNISTPQLLHPMSERLQKILATAGIASRRKAEEIITAGRVSLNGEVVTELGTKADLSKDTICVDGKPLQRPQRFVYFLLNKPKGYVTTVSDPEGRPTVMHLLGNLPERVYPVGRLDYASEGLLLMTNDGALAQKLTKAGSHIPKTYHVKISGKPNEQAIQKLRDGVTISARRQSPRQNSLHARDPPSSKTSRQSLVRSQS